jgi:hypothetical protein
VLAVEGNINIKEWTRVHSSLEVSLHKDKWDFYFRALGSLVVLSFLQLLSFSSVLFKPLSETVTSAGTAGCPTVQHL